MYFKMGDEQGSHAGRQLTVSQRDLVGKVMNGLFKGCDTLVHGFDPSLERCDSGLERRKSGVDLDSKILDMVEELCGDVHPNVDVGHGSTWDQRSG